MDIELLKELAEMHKKELKESSEYALEMAMHTIGVDVLVNNEPKTVVIETRKNRDGNERVAFSYLDDIQIGDYIDFYNQKWIAYSHPTFNNVYSKIYLKRCNSSISVPHKIKSVQIQNDDWRTNLVKYKDEIEYIELPCSSESRIYQSEFDDRPINLPSGQLVVTIPYNESAKNIKINYQFEMYGDKYKVVHMDRNHIISERGILILTCELVN